MTSKTEMKVPGPDKFIWRATMVTEPSAEKVPCELVFTRISEKRAVEKR